MGMVRRSYVYWAKPVSFISSFYRFCVRKIFGCCNRVADPYSFKLVDPVMDLSSFYQTLRIQIQISCLTIKFKKSSKPLQYSTGIVVRKVSGGSKINWLLDLDLDSEVWYTSRFKKILGGKLNIILVRIRILLTLYLCDNSHRFKQCLDLIISFWASQIRIRHFLYESGSRSFHHSVAVPGFFSWIRDPNLFHSKKLFLSSRKYDPGCSSWSGSRSQTPDPGSGDFMTPGSQFIGFIMAPDPGSGYAILFHHQAKK